MKRIITDYNKLSDGLKDSLKERYPFGFNNKDFITFKNSKGKFVKTVELITEDTIYLVKIARIKLEEKHKEENKEIDSIDDVDFNVDDQSWD